MFSLYKICCCSVTKLCPTLCNLMDCSMPGLPVPHHLLELALVYVHWCHPTISLSVTLFFFCLQSFPASESFPVSQLFALGGQSTRASASASILPMNIQGAFRIDWFDLLANQGSLKSLLQHPCSNASILQLPAFFIVWLSHPYKTTGKTVALTIRTFVS